MRMENSGCLGINLFITSPISVFANSSTLLKSYDPFPLPAPKLLLVLTMNIFFRSAGGCQNFAATFCFNPQYYFDIKEPNSEEVMIALTQKDGLAEHARQREPFVTIGIHIMRVECNRRYRIHQAVNQ
uniref:Peptidase C2 calpain large subunit domain-containing protein n=1 Tax=Ditylenchus dipsaci TaxID=166011 RepID=A0A915DKM4_9BILA